MYSSRGSNAYGQPPYGGQSSYGQNLGSGYSGSSVPEGGSQVSLSSRNPSILGGSGEAEVGAYRSHTSAAPYYGGQYSSVYSSTALSAAQQVPGIKGAGPSALEGRGGYASAVHDSPKFSSGDYVSSSSHAYGHKGDPIYAEKIPDYSAIERRQYGERQGSYLGRDMKSEPTTRFSDAASFGHQHQSEIYDRLDQASLLRQEQLLKPQSLQSPSLDGSARQADYLAARTSRHSTHDLMSYEARIDADPRGLSMLSASSYSGQPVPSILGAAPHRNIDDLLYSQGSSNPGYGVSLPPGRDYASGKGLHITSIDPGSMFSRGGHPRLDDRKDDRASYLREFELREEERRREQLRERERNRAREKERERERERERLRERERERERERILQRREKEKEKERDRKRATEIKRERTPSRVSRDRHGSSSTKDGRSTRRDSPRHEVVHRRHSPVKEKRRDYVCKVNSFDLVDVERDYPSIDKRYPKLFVSPELSRVVVNWPKGNLSLSFHTPVSFEHDFIEDEDAVDPKEASAKLLTEGPANFDQRSTVWNAKILLMSGLSKNSLEELASEKSSDDRIPHICNILRFAVLKKDHSFMAIGGRWNFADDGDPSVDDSSLVQTAIRCAKETTQLNLQNCRNWNRFLEIHYDRVGKDGLFSHKEITVFFVPDLSECLPSFDTWRAQWVAHKKAVAERERQLSLRKKRSREKDGLKDKETKASKDAERKRESSSTGKGEDAKQKEKGGSDMKGKAADQKGNGSDKKVGKRDGSGTGEGKNVEKDETETAKPGKRKVLRRVVKQKVVDKASSAQNAEKTEDDKADEKVIAEQKKAPEISGQQEESSAEPAVKTFTRKKVTKKVAAGDNTSQEDAEVQLEVKAEEEMDCSDDKAKNDPDPSSAVAVKEAGVKTTVKKKIIKRVIKRKVAAKAKDGVGELKRDGDSDESKVAQTGNETESKNKVTPEKKSETESSKKQDSLANSGEMEIKDDKVDKKDGKGTELEPGSNKAKAPLKDNNNNSKKGKSKDGENAKDEKVKKDKDGKDESKGNSNRELNEKKKMEEPPRHPGLILQTKWTKESRLRSLSLSLDSLLDYTDKDIEDSSFELSLFAETLYEMLQYQMGCRLLSFLQRLRIKFLAKRNQRKRQLEEDREKEKENNSPAKRIKTSELPVKSETSKSEASNSVQQSDDKTMIKEENPANDVDDARVKEETDDEEEPEEDPEEYEEMEEDANPQRDSSDEMNKEEGKSDVDDKAGKESSNGKDDADESTKERNNVEGAEKKDKSDVNAHEKRESKGETGKKEVVDKELLQAFRFFDRNRVGYVRVEDMRLIIHSLGKFLSHRDVKELVQSALLESNTGRDDRILYNKLVRLSDI